MEKRDGYYQIHNAPLTFARIAVPVGRESEDKKIRITVLWHYLFVKPLTDAAKDLVILFKSPVS